MSQSWTSFAARILARYGNWRRGKTTPSDARGETEEPDAGDDKNESTDVADEPMQLSLAQVATFKEHVQALDRLVIQADAVNTAALSIALARLVHTGQGDAAALLEEIATLRDRAREERAHRPGGNPVMDKLIELTTALEADVRAAARGERS